MVQVARYVRPLTWARGTAWHSVLEPLLNVIEPPSAGPTVAVKVTFWPKVPGFCEEVTVVTGAGRAALITDTVPSLALAT